jgi:stress response protein YsnF
MPALDPETRERWRDMVVVDRESATVGTITAFFLDEARGLPTWALVHSGWLADRQIFVPLTDAVEAGGEIRLPYTKDQVTKAPRIDPGGELTADDELVLSAHYGLHDHHGAVIERHRSDAQPPGGPHPPTPTSSAATPEPSPPTSAPPTSAPPTPGPPTPAPLTMGTPEPEPPVSGAPTGRVAAGGEERDRLSTAPPAEPDGGGVVVTRSEEELRVGVRTRLRRLRVRKYVVTEYVTRTIPVRREKVRVEELPSDQVVDGGADQWRPAGAPGEAGGADGPGDANGPGGAGEAGAAELELILHREEPVVQLRTVPVERVRLVKQLVSDRRTVTAELRKEQVELDEDPPRT